MATTTYDYYNHEAPAPGTTMTASTTGTTVAGTIVPVAAGAGTGSSVTLPTGSTPNDVRGQFNLVTAGVPAAGAVAALYFSEPYGTLPTVIVSATDNTGTVAPIPMTPVVTQSSVTFYAGALTAAHTITVNYHVIP